MTPIGLNDLADESRLVDDLARSLAQGRTDVAAALFRAAGARAPTILWRPTVLDVAHPVLRSFLRGCEGAPEGVMPTRWIESEAFAALADWCMVLEATPDGADYVYRHYGHEIARAYGRDMVGCRVSAFGDHVAPFFIGLYHAAAARRETVKSVHEPPRQVFVRAWRRVVVPLSDGAGPVTRFAVTNVADNELRAGLDVLPDAVMVVSAAGGMCYANRAACLLFGDGHGPEPGAPVEAFTGCEIKLPRGGPDQLILEGKQWRYTVPGLRNRTVTEVNVTVGATYYRGAPFYVISVREAG